MCPAFVPRAVLPPGLLPMLGPGVLHLGEPRGYLPAVALTSSRAQGLSESRELL